MMHDVDRDKADAWARKVYDDPDASEADNILAVALIEARRDVEAHQKRIAELGDTVGRMAANALHEAKRYAADRAEWWQTVSELRRDLTAAHAELRAIGEQALAILGEAA